MIKIQDSNIFLCFNKQIYIYLHSLILYILLKDFWFGFLPWSNISAKLEQD